MAQTTNIEWCDATLNVWWGCTKVSEGCKFCYAEHLADHRYQKGNWGPKGTRREVKSWRSTLDKISKRAKEEGRRLRVFCQSMSDTFEGPETMGGEESENYHLICQLQLELMFAILDHPELDFLLLTKRPENVMPTIRRIRYHNSQKDHPDFQRVYDELIYPWTGGISPSNVWIGTSVEDQKTSDERIPHLMAIPAAVRFLSCEPLLGPVDLMAKDEVVCKRCGTQLQVNTDSEPTERCPKCGCDHYVWDTPEGKIRISDMDIDWVICGGESGPNARPMNPEWPRSLRDQCRVAGVPFLFKQWGEWLPGHHYTDELRKKDPDPELSKFKVAQYIDGEYTIGYELAEDIEDENALFKVGKKAAGRLLDGRTWDEFPEVK